MSWRKTSNTRQGTSTLYGAADYNTLMDLLNGVDTGQQVTINNNWAFTKARQPTGITVTPGANSITTAMLQDSAVTGVKIAAGTIDNTDISATAAIAKSKLAALAIVDADVASGAAIAKAKLAPLNIADADVSATAAIAKSKLAALNIANADVAAAAAIAYSKLNLASSVAPADLNAALGQPYQVPQINAAGNAVQYADSVMMPSSGRLYGARMGFASTTTTNGLGILQAVAQGSNATAVGQITAVDGNHVVHNSGTSNNKGRAGWWGIGGTERKFNPIFTVRYKLGQAFTSANGILYIGLQNQASQPAAGTGVLDTYLDGASKIGVLFGYRSVDTHRMIISNNAQTLATYTDLGVAPDGNIHTVSIQITDSPAQINWWFDGVAQTSITNTTNNVPPSTTQLYPILILEAQTATGQVITEHWSQISMDWI